MLLHAKAFVSTFKTLYIQNVSVCTGAHVSKTCSCGPHAVVVSVCTVTFWTYTQGRVRCIPLSFLQHSNTQQQTHTQSEHSNNTTQKMQLRSEERRRKRWKKRRREDKETITQQFISFWPEGTIHNESMAINTRLQHKIELFSESYYTIQDCVPLKNWLLARRKNVALQYKIGLSQHYWFNFRFVPSSAARMSRSVSWCERHFNTLFQKLKHSQRGQCLSHRAGAWPTCRSFGSAAFTGLSFFHHHAHCISLLPVTLDHVVFRVVMRNLTPTWSIATVCRSGRWSILCSVFQCKFATVMYLPMVFEALAHFFILFVCKARICAFQEPPRTSSQVTEPLLATLTGGFPTWPSWFKKFKDVPSLASLTSFFFQIVTVHVKPVRTAVNDEPCCTSLEVFGRLSRVWRWATSTSMRDLKPQSSWLETRLIRLQCRMLASPWRYQHHVVFFCEVAAAPPHVRGGLDCCGVTKTFERSTTGCPRSTECWSTTGSPAFFRSWTTPATFPYVVLLGITPLRQERRRVLQSLGTNCAHNGLRWASRSALQTSFHHCSWWNLWLRYNHFHDKTFHVSMWLSCCVFFMLCVSSTLILDVRTRASAFSCFWNKVCCEICIFSPPSCHGPHSPQSTIHVTFREHSDFLLITVSFQNGALLPFCCLAHFRNSLLT